MSMYGLGKVTSIKNGLALGLAQAITSIKSRKFSLTKQKSTVNVQDSEPLDSDVEIMYVGSSFSMHCRAIVFTAKRRGSSPGLW
jgi:hypothetical protein